MPRPINSMQDDTTLVWIRLRLLVQLQCEVTDALHLTTAEPAEPDANLVDPRNW